MNDQPASADENPPAEKPSIWQGWAARRYREWLQEYRANKAKRDATEHAAISTARATWFIGLFTLVTAGIGISHYFAFHGQLEAMQGQLAEIKATSAQTERTIKAFERLADAAAQSATLQTQTSERQLRAYVSVQPGSANWQSESLWVEFIIKNTGVTPGHNIRGAGRFELFDAVPSEEQIKQGNFAQTKVNQASFPGTDHSIFLFRGFDVAERARMKKKGATVLVCVEINYMDVFTKERNTTLCGMTPGADLLATAPVKGKSGDKFEVIWFHAHEYAD